MSNKGLLILIGVIVIGLLAIITVQEAEPEDASFTSYSVSEQVEINDVQPNRSINM